MHDTHLALNISKALQQLESVKAAVDQSNDPKLKAATNEDLNMLINLLDSPILRSIATLHDSVGMLATQVAHHPSILPGDFDITPAGELALQSRNLYGGHEGEEEQRVPQVSPPHSLDFGSDNERILGLDSGSVDSSLSPQQNRGILDLSSRTEDSLASASHNIVVGDWAQVEIINLVNDGTGLGFGIIGARTSGVIVKTILAGGVADRDGRLRSGDHILQIGDVSLLSMGSERVAGVLRASGTRVRLVVARAVDPAAAHAAPAPIVPARLLSDPEALDRYLLEAGCEQVFNTQPTPPLANNQRFHFDDSLTTPVDSDAESPEVDRFTVQLKKDENGLGITIAGYVCEKEELSGIFVKSVTAGSAAALSGAVRVNDRIVAVDGVSLAGKSNQRAVDALKQSGNVVTLELERYLRGPKYEQLQQAIAATEAAPPAPAPPNPFLHMHRPDNAPEQGPVVTTNITEPVSIEEEESRSGANSRATDVARPTRVHPPFEMPRTQEQKDAIKKKWQAILGDDVEIVVGIVVRGGGGLGISLEGTVDVEGGREVRPHHYVRSVLPEGPVGRAAVHRPGDELLEVNGHRLLGMNHLEVVSILKELSSEVCMVCARPRPPPPQLAPPANTLVKAKSDGSLAGAGADEGGALGSGGKARSRSLEPLTGLAMWAEEPQVIELVKGERGLGFSILDYQDPLRPAHTLVVIRSLVPGGVAQQDARLIPGDRLLFVNDQNLENASLEQAVAALKGAPRGVVRIGVAKPLPLADAPTHPASLDTD
ncbi:patj homolog isoform X1 [Plutella xylostella]|uniref:patj homolog isoform X1 n=1 Tax=Plutella xylostella TaxID=51655 RepID=UPI0020329725|nr:patj homolog isoform X1 [Plutella xylostella]XP_048488665.1 patj homolog isoform X2 [Plutella xylostella]XP_048488670.1 patj homolog isoform X1 [Plutella xylostella]